MEGLIDLGEKTEPGTCDRVHATASATSYLLPCAPTKIDHSVICKGEAHNLIYFY